MSEKGGEAGAEKRDLPEEKKKGGFPKRGPCQKQKNPVEGKGEASFFPQKEKNCTELRGGEEDRKGKGKRPNPGANPAQGQKGEGGRTQEKRKEKHN